MNKAFEKIIEKLEEEKMFYFLTIANTGDEKLDYAYEKVGNALDKAIEIVKQEAEKYSTKNCSECSRRKFYQIGYAEGKKDSGWISCNERLPEDDKKKYMVQTTNGFIDILGFTKDAYKLDRYDFAEYRGKKKQLFYDYDTEYGYIECECEVWKPLPQPYQPKGEIDE